MPPILGFVGEGDRLLHEGHETGAVDFLNPVSFRTEEGMYTHKPMDLYWCKELPE